MLARKSEGERTHQFESGQPVGQRALQAAQKIDGALDPVRAADALREAAEQGLQTYTMPVEGVMKGDQAALELLDDAEPILDYFRGVSASPPPTTTIPG